VVGRNHVVAVAHVRAHCFAAYAHFLNDKRAN